MSVFVTASSCAEESAGPDGKVLPMWMWMTCAMRVCAALRVHGVQVEATPIQASCCVCEPCRLYVQCLRNCASETELVFHINSKHLENLTELISPVIPGSMENLPWAISMMPALMTTREFPVSSISVCLLATFMSSPAQGSWKRLRHLIMYLTSTQGHCVCLEVCERC